MTLGLFTEADAGSATHSIGEREVEHLFLRLPPFDEPWEDWQPIRRGSRPSSPGLAGSGLTGWTEGQRLAHGLGFRLRP